MQFVKLICGSTTLHVWLSYLTDLKCKSLLLLEIIKRVINYVFLVLRLQVMYKGFPSYKISNVAGTCLGFCGEQRGYAPLLVTKSHLCTCDII